MIDEREARLATGQQRLADTRVDRRDVLPRDRATDDLVFELVAAAALLRLELDHDVAVLALTAGLADVAPFGFDRNGDRLLVGDLRPADIRIDPELAHQAIDDDFEMKLAHALDDRLASFLVRAQAEGRILFSQPAKRGAHLVLVGSRLRLDRDGDDRLREGDRFEHDRRSRDRKACHR